MSNNSIISEKRLSNKSICHVGWDVLGIWVTELLIIQNGKNL